MFKARHFAILKNNEPLSAHTDRSSLAKLSSCLREASEVVKKILDEETQTSRPESSRSSGSRVFSALQRARLMLDSSQASASGRCKRLNKRERLRASSTVNDQGQRIKAMAFLIHIFWYYVNLRFYVGIIVISFRLLVTANVL